MTSTHINMLEMPIRQKFKASPLDVSYMIVSTSNPEKYSGTEYFTALRASPIGQQYLELRSNGATSGSAIDLIAATRATERLLVEGLELAKNRFLPELFPQLSSSVADIPPTQIATQDEMLNFARGFYHIAKASLEFALLTVDAPGRIPNTHLKIHIDMGPFESLDRRRDSRLTSHTNMNCALDSSKGPISYSATEAAGLYLALKIAHQMGAWNRDLPNQAHKEFEVIFLEKGYFRTLRSFRTNSGHILNLVELLADQHFLAAVTLPEDEAAELVDITDIDLNGLASAPSSIAEVLQGYEVKQLIWKLPEVIKRILVATHEPDAQVFTASSGNSVEVEAVDVERTKIFLDLAQKANALRFALHLLSLTDLASELGFNAKVFESPFDLYKRMVRDNLTNRPEWLERLASTLRRKYGPDILTTYERELREVEYENEMDEILRLFCAALRAFPEAV